MQVNQGDLGEFKDWLFFRGVRPVMSRKIALTVEPLSTFETAGMGKPGKGNKAGKPFAIWWEDFFVCDFGAYRLVYDARRPHP